MAERRGEGYARTVGGQWSSGGCTFRASKWRRSLLARTTVSILTLLVATLARAFPPEPKQSSSGGTLGIGNEELLANDVGRIRARDPPLADINVLFRLHHRRLGGKGSMRMARGHSRRAASFVLGSLDSFWCWRPRAWSPGKPGSLSPRRLTGLSSLVEIRMAGSKMICFISKSCTWTI